MFPIAVAHDQNSSRNALRASSNETPCFCRFALFFPSPHSNTKSMVPRYRNYSVATRPVERLPRSNGAAGSLPDEIRCDMRRLRVDDCVVAPRMKQHLVQAPEHTVCLATACAVLRCAVCARGSLHSAWLASGQKRSLARHPSAIARNVMRQPSTRATLKNSSGLLVVCGGELAKGRTDKVGKAGLVRGRGTSSAHFGVD
jgi:hypothetical protein